MAARRSCRCGRPPTPSRARGRCGFASERAASTSQTSSRARVCIPTHPGCRRLSAMRSRAPVDEVGSGVDQALIGTEVVALTRFGGYADVVSVPAKQVFEKPAALSHEQAAGIPVSYLTAWQLLVVMGSLKPGETVLIHNAGGGVGLAAIDVATPRRGDDLRHRQHRQACVPHRARGARSHRLPSDRLGDRGRPADRREGSVARHRSVRRQALDEELPCSALDGQTRDVRRLSGDGIEAAGAAPPRKGRARHADVSPGGSDELEPVGLRRESRSHVARDRHDRGLDASRSSAGWPKGGCVPTSTGASRSRTRVRPTPTSKSAGTSARSS